MIYAIHPAIVARPKRAYGPSASAILMTEVKAALVALKTRTKYL